MALPSDIRRIAGLLQPEAGAYAIGLGSLFLLNVCDVLAPVFMAAAIDLTEAELTGGVAQTPTVLRWLGVDVSTMGIVAAIVVFLGLNVLANLLRYPMLMFTAVPSHRIGQTVRNRLVDHMLRLSRSWYDRAKSGDLMSLATNDVNATRMMLGPGVLVGADTLMIVSLVVVVMFALSWKLALIAMIPLPIIALVTNRLSHAEYDRFAAVQADIARLTERARESYAGIRILQGYARERFDRRRFARFSWEHFLKNLRLARVRALFMPTLDLMLGASTVLVLIFGGLQVLDGSISLGTFVAFLFLVGYLSGPMIGFGWSVSLFQRGRASLKRLDTFLAEPIEIEDAPDARPVPSPASLEVRGLTHVWPNPPPSDDDEATSGTDDDGAGDAADDAETEDRPPALVDVSFTIEPGRTLGIIGPVGSGKSTLVQLLARLYEPPEGTILLGGVDIRDIALDSLRESIVVAPQETFLFSDTVARNIGLIDHQLDPVHFARLAELHSEIDALPEGYETMLGERGVNLSGGQRQRLAIARAIAADPQLLVLDDCLSAVDARTERAILARLRDIFEGRSGIIVSHRVAAVRACDEILVLEDGRVTERGTHDELVGGDGYYGRTARAQSDGHDGADDDGGAA